MAAWVAFPLALFAPARRARGCANVFFPGLARGIFFCFSYEILLKLGINTHDSRENLGYKGDMKTNEQVKHMNYRETQSQLKQLRSNGHKLTCALNAKHKVLTAELERLTSTSVPAQPTQELDPLESANARIKELEALLQSREQEIYELISENNKLKEQQVASIEVQPSAELEPVTVDESKALETLEKMYSTDDQDYDDFVSFADLAEQMNITPEQLHPLVQALEAKDAIETCTLSDPGSTNGTQAAATRVYNASYSEGAERQGSPRVAYCKPVKPQA